MILVRPTVCPSVRPPGFVLPPPLNGFLGAVRPAAVARLAVVGELAELARRAATLVDGPGGPLPQLPQHPDRLELPVGGAVAAPRAYAHRRVVAVQLTRRRVDEPAHAAPRREDAVARVTGGGLEDGGVERADVVWNRM